MHAEKKTARRQPWNEIHVALDRAIAWIEPTGAEGVILQAARELSYRTARLWGLDDPLPFEINVSALARAKHKPRNNLVRGMQRLRKAGIIVDLHKIDECWPRGWLWINKHHRSWLPPLRVPPAVWPEIERGLPIVRGQESPHLPHRWGKGCTTDGALVAPELGQRLPQEWGKVARPPNNPLSRKKELDQLSEAQTQGRGAGEDEQKAFIAGVRKHLEGRPRHAG